LKHEALTAIDCDFFGGASFHLFAEGWRGAIDRDRPGDAVNGTSEGKDLMRVMEYVIGGVFLLIGLYLVLVNPSAVDKIIKSSATFGIGSIGVLQGRSVSGLGGVSVGGFQGSLAGG
jgi:hypothetical protein